MDPFLDKALEQAEEALAHDEFDRAEIAYRAALSIDPHNAIAGRALAEIASLRISVLGDQLPSLPKDTVVRLAVPLARLLADDVTVREAFVLSRLVSGALAVDDLLWLCEPPHDEVLDIVGRFLALGFVVAVR